MRLSITIVGDREISAKLAKMPAAVHAALLVKMHALTLMLQGYIQQSKLSGQVLKVKTGALRRSIFQEVTDRASAVVGRVYSSGDVKYAAIHEFGGQTKAHIIRPRKAEALSFMMGGRRIFASEVHHPGSKMPVRSFMRTGLADKAGIIERELKRTVVGALQKTKGAGH